ncbi:MULTISPECIES: branched-chain amino acid ABC transporter permease [Haloferax]|uniref:branched-chain amino acid ABC transporter permease n=1 Tax=Haloferax TaxID=2251 RepID=UPI000B1B5BF6|nr:MULTISPECIES: branched-chain amino acid ABC transporter permease [Haloferax]
MSGEGLSAITERFNGSTMFLWYGVALVAFIVLYALPFLVDSPYYLNLIAWIQILGIAVLGYNIIFGYAGSLSFGHAAFFGTGAYTVALLMKYTGIRELFILVILGAVAAVAVAAVIGAVTLNTSDIYYSLLTLALAQILYVLAAKLYNITNGTDGIGVGQPHVFGQAFESLTVITFLTELYYYIVVLAFGLSIVFAWLIVKSPFGLTLKTLRENPERARAMGIPVKRYRWYATLLSGLFVGFSGALYSVLSGHITPEILDWTYSGQIVFMTLIGGASTFGGPLVGATIYVLLREYAVALVSNYWQFTMGFIMFVIVVTLRSDGLWGGAKRLVRHYGGSDNE